MSRRTSSPDSVAASAPPWVWITPFGVPRLPDVNTIARSSAGRTDASSAATRSGRGAASTEGPSSSHTATVRSRGTASTMSCVPATSSGEIAMRSAT